MSSDQQFNTQIPDVNGLCLNKHKDNQPLNQQSEFECSISGYTNIEKTSQDKVFEEETINQRESELIEPRLQTNENHTQTESKENSIFKSCDQTDVCVDANEGIEHSVGKFGIKLNNDDVSLTNGALEQIGSSYLEDRNGRSPSLNNETTTSATTDDQFNNVESQTSNQPSGQNSDIFTESQPQNFALTEKKNSDPTSKQINNNETKTSEANDEVSNSLNSSAVFEEEIGNDDVTSDDENVRLSNEQDSNEDSNDLPDIVDFDGTNEVENDEYILDTVVRKPRKERRRIVSVNDDSDPEVNLERERLPQSPEVAEAEFAYPENVEENINIERLIENEKPGPKSKKISTQKLKELQARELLRNAVVIPLSNKKKKSRIIDSDDEDENTLLPYCVDVDDIGLPDIAEDNDNESDVLATSSILLNDIDKPDDQHLDEEQSSPSISPDEIIGNEITPIPELPQKDMSVQESPGSENVNNLLEMAPNSNEKSCDASKLETTVTCDSENGTDNLNQEFKTEHASETENIEFPPFPFPSSSEEDDEFIPNEIYFGTPDNKKCSRGKGRGKRGHPAQTASRQITNSKNVVRPVEKGRGSSRRGRPHRRDNRRTSSSSGSISTSSSSESDYEYEKSKARRKPHTKTVVEHPPKLYHKVNVSVRPIQKQRQINRKRDRFYDKSQDIPNAIYFGDIDVPLHVLHTYGDSDSDNATGINSNCKVAMSTNNEIRFSSQVARGRGSMPISNSLGQVHNNARNQHMDNRKARGRPKVSSVSPSNDRSIQMMKKCLKAAGLRKVKLNRLWEGCKSNSERAAKMLELLREKGLEGEPTISKCRQLKVDYLTKKEIEDLDPNLIIQTEGRTRRSVTRAATKRQYTYDEEEILETRTKLRKVIDSDSDC